MSIQVGIDQSSCKHFWRIDNEIPVAKGKCKICNAEKDFVSTWYTESAESKKRIKERVPKASLSPLKES